MKDLLAKLDELHAKATSTPEDSEDESHILAAVGLQFEAAHHWPAIRAYIANLEAQRYRPSDELAPRFF